jgi:Lon protease-like protein
MRSLPLFPLEQVVLFPGMPLPLRIFEERYKVMIGACQVTDRLFGVLLIRSGREVGEPAVPEQVGCTARIAQLERVGDGQMHLLALGEHRFRLRGPPRVMPEGYLEGDVEILSDESGPVVPAELLGSVGQELEKYNQLLGGQRGIAPALPTDAQALSYRAAAMLYVHPRERQQLLELDDVQARLQQTLKLLRRENRPAAGAIGPFSRN